MSRRRRRTTKRKVCGWRVGHASPRHNPFLAVHCPTKKGRGEGSGGGHLRVKKCLTMVIAAVVLCQVRALFVLDMLPLFHCIFPPLHFTLPSPLFPAEYIWRIFNFGQMDFQQATTQMINLCRDPRGAYKSTRISKCNGTSGSPDVPDFVSRIAS